MSFRNLLPSWALTSEDWDSEWLQRWPPERDRYFGVYSERLEGTVGQFIDATGYEKLGPTLDQLLSCFYDIFVDVFHFLRSITLDEIEDLASEPDVIRPLFGESLEGGEPGYVGFPYSDMFDISHVDFYMLRDGFGLERFAEGWGLPLYILQSKDFRAFSELYNVKGSSPTLLPFEFKLFDSREAESALWVRRSLRIGQKSIERISMEFLVRFIIGVTFVERYCREGPGRQHRSRNVGKSDALHDVVIPEGKEYEELRRKRKAYLKALGKFSLI